MNDEIKDRVKASVDLADWIKRDGIPLKGGPNEFKACCPFHTEKTPSFTVVNKENGWFFHCFGCDAQGDIFEWVMRRKGLAFPQALQFVANSVGISVPVSDGYTPTSAGRLYQPAPPRERPEPERGPFDPDKFQPLQVGSPAYVYLTEKRKLPPQLLVDYSVGQTRDGAAYVFAYKWRAPHWPKERAPRFEFVKVVQVERPEGKKVEWREPKGGKNVLFGMVSPLVETAYQLKDEIIICEGEIDAITWAAYGFPAVSVPGGAKYTGWIDLCWEWLQAFSKIHISFDEDNAGRLKVEEIVTRLGMARTDIIRLPEKEATDAV